jgi:hypothetical protein
MSHTEGGQRGMKAGVNVPGPRLPTARSALRGDRAREERVSLGGDQRFWRCAGARGLGIASPVVVYKSG